MHGTKYANHQAHHLEVQRLLSPDGRWSRCEWAGAVRKKRNDPRRHHRSVFRRSQEERENANVTSLVAIRHGRVHAWGAVLLVLLFSPGGGGAGRGQLSQACVIRHYRPRMFRSEADAPKDLRLRNDGRDGAKGGARLHTAGDWPPSPEVVKRLAARGVRCPVPLQGGALAHASRGALREAVAVAGRPLAPSPLPPSASGRSAARFEDGSICPYDLHAGLPSICPAQPTGAAPRPAWCPSEMVNHDW